MNRPYASKATTDTLEIGRRNGLVRKGPWECVPVQLTIAASNEFPPGIVLGAVYFVITRKRRASSIVLCVEFKFRWGSIYIGQSGL